MFVMYIEIYNGNLDMLQLLFDASVYCSMQVLDLWLVLIDQWISVDHSTT